MHSCTHTCCSGQLTVWRNTESTKRMFMDTPNWQKDYQTASFSKMDELTVAYPSLDRLRVLFLESQLTTQRLDGKPNTRESGTSMQNAIAAWVDGKLLLLGKDASRWRESPCQALPCRGVRAEHVVRSEGALLHLNQQKVGTPDLPEQILNQREPRTALSAHLRPVCRTVEIDQVSQRGGYVE